MFKELQNEIREINIANGWNVLQPDEWDNPYKLLAILALIHSEVSEATEEVRKDNKENFVEELADVIIRVLDCITGLGDDVDIEAVIRAKLEKNRQRAYRHGGKRA